MFKGEHTISMVSLFGSRSSGESIMTLPFLLGGLVCFSRIMPLISISWDPFSFYSSLEALDSLNEDR